MATIGANVPVSDERTVLHTTRFHFLQSGQVCLELAYVNWSAVMALFGTYHTTMTPAPRLSSIIFSNKFVADAWALGPKEWQRRMCGEWALLHHLRSDWFNTLVKKLASPSARSRSRQTCFNTTTREIMLPLWQFLSGQDSSLAATAAALLQRGHPYQGLTSILTAKEKVSCTYAGNPMLYLA
jgi:hypothetical protein